MKKVTIKDIARKAEVSIATVSRVLNNTGYASKEVKENVLKTAKMLNYQPNEIARSLKSNVTNTVGMIIPDISNPYFMRISKGIEDTIQANGYNLIFMSSDEDSEKESTLIKILTEKRVDAIVIATSGDNEKAIKAIKKYGIPTVLVDRKINTYSDDFDVIEEDNINKAYELSKQLLNEGHFRIGVINGTLNTSTGAERYKGFQKAMQEYNLKIDEELIFNGSFKKEDGMNAVDNFLKLKRKPTAIISFNNAMTFGAIIQLIKKDVSIPEDIQIASYGEVEEAQLLKNSGIISVKQFPYEMGLETGRKLLTYLPNGEENNL